MKKFKLNSLIPLNSDNQKKIAKEIQIVTNNCLNTNNSKYFFENDLITSSIKNFSINFEVVTYDSSEEIIIQCPEYEGQSFYFKHMYELIDFPETYSDNSNHASLSFEEGVFIISALFINPYKDVITLDDRPYKIKIHLRDQNEILSYITITG
ncbi:MAG: hypothetical protein NE328_01710 [Lentisphaeraceae bacterium]|nr:hypothetical protein [Lentisphaeraceae bacterium]